ncbi:GSTK1 [Cordylochernes scorpioides]|uniref:GSTK1 n=1 Tax=Cordylochernes scorpioides TaxID=51811 RepID=A0ABY6LFQ6_9ARAC|nr:GSTK1 [Cordylochernes scorpioides]
MGALSKSPLLVELFYDVVSPYSWLAFEVLCRYRPIWNLNLQFRPVLLGGIMKESGNRPPMMVPGKGLYMIKDIERLSKFYKVPVTIPPIMTDFILNGPGSRPAQRFLTALQQDSPAQLEAMSRSLWNQLLCKLPLVNMSTCELHSVIRFFTAKNETAVNIHRNLVSVYGEGCMSIQMVRRWRSWFLEGWQNVHDDERSGRPVTATDNAAVAAVWNVVEADRRVTIDKIMIRLPPGI